MTEKNSGDGNVKPKYFVIALIMILVFLFSLKSGPDQHSHQFLSVNSPDRSHVANVSISTLNKTEGYFLSVSIFNNNGELLRKDFYRQWNCGNVAISWKTDNELTINGVSVNWASDTIEFGVNGGNKLCPVRSFVY